MFSAIRWGKKGHEECVRVWVVCQRACAKKYCDTGKNPIPSIPKTLNWTDLSNTIPFQKGILIGLKLSVKSIHQNGVFHICSTSHFPAGVPQPCLAPLMKGPKHPLQKSLQSPSTSRVSKLIVIHLCDRKSFPSCHWGPVRLCLRL